MSDPILSQAKRWGFCCQRTAAGPWQITPTQGDWVLEQRSDAVNEGLSQRWLLSIKGVPQVSLDATEVLAFLKLRIGGNPR
ncbi:MAG: hypothetical protein EA366_00800 [Spirulina sp. DLM2.Bin59]|nr:MAG: hypothetical protein EA366_00800 [Spirulina sp. DLM2.Bin59]